MKTFTVALILVAILAASALAQQDDGVGVPGGRTAYEHLQHKKAEAAKELEAESIRSSGVLATANDSVNKLNQALPDLLGHIKETLATAKAASTADSPDEQIKRTGPLVQAAVATIKQLDANDEALAAPLNTTLGMYQALLADDRAWYERMKDAAGKRAQFQAEIDDLARQIARTEAEIEEIKKDKRASATDKERKIGVQEEILAELQHDQRAAAMMEKGYAELLDVAVSGQVRVGRVLVDVDSALSRHHHYASTYTSLRQLLRDSLESLALEIASLTACQTTEQAAAEMRRIEAIVAKIETALKAMQ